MSEPLQIFLRAQYELLDQHLLCEKYFSIQKKGLIFGIIK